MSVKSFCANQAATTTPSCALMAPKQCGLSLITTTAFCTVLLVTSAGLLISRLASNCRVHDMPKSEVAASVEVAERRRVKYE
jgi:hypothetical protein